MASGFPVLEPMGVPLRQIFRYKATEGRGGGERRSSCLRGKRPAAFRGLCQIGYSVGFLPATFALWHFRPPFPCIVKTSRSWKPQGFKQKGKD